ncbi:MAG: alpha/beta hydrolase [Nitratireductor sp.]
MIDWDAAYDNRGAVKDSPEYVMKWGEEAARFRAHPEGAGNIELGISYGALERERLDIFHPTNFEREGSKGLIVFVHGGYWKTFDKNAWSHMAKGPLAHGWSVAIVSYSLVPEVRISHITKQINAAVECAAKLVKGPIRLSGHSAGGHLVSRLCCEDSLLSDKTLQRIEQLMSISGVHDLRPLLKLQMNEVFGLDAQEAENESPCLKAPHPLLAKKCDVTCWVGEDELPEFVRQNDFLAEAWKKLGMNITNVHFANRHHFSVIDDLAEAGSELTQKLAAQN